MQVDIGRTGRWNTSTAKSPRASVSETLRQAVVDSGLSLRELGRQARVSGSQLSRFVCGERQPTARAINGLAEALGLELTKKKGDRRKG